MSTNENTAGNLLSIESLINNYNARFEEIQKEFKQHKEMMNGILENDDEFQTINEEASKQAKLKTIAKQKVLKQPEAAKLQDKIKEYQSQIREIKTALSDYLGQYVALAGTNQIEGPDGVVRQIIYTAKLIKLK